MFIIHKHEQIGVRQVEALFPVSMPDVFAKLFLV